ncbi:methionine adenosyltransferase [Candidatus Woesearchaeota archaeon]|nr:methionine adenosyltransferase [Candidatus Woesearchaeota archaeon]
MRKIIIDSIKKGAQHYKVVMVERKGVGHPDTLTDQLCQAASTALSRYYLKHFNRILHHNVDKGLLIAGESRPRFGGGKLVKPVEIYIAGRATSKVDDKLVDVNKIIKDEVDKHLKKYKDLNYKLHIEVKDGAANLQEVFKKQKPVANDTSFGVGHAPLSKTEKLALDICDYLNFELSKKIKAIGDDIKVMATRVNDKMNITIAIAFIDKYIKSMDDYIKTKDDVKEELEKFIKIPCNIEINTLDDVNGDESTVYLTCTGLSAEHGDDGQTGRGNRPNGLITPNRPMSMEATAGKNINHPGLLYQAISQVIAHRISELGTECYVKMLTQIGKSLEEPLVSIELKEKVDESKVKGIVNEVLDNLEKYKQDIVLGKVRLF